MESRHHFQNKGVLAEAVIHSLATDTFFTDWCYPNPRKPDGRELCDLLVVFDDTAIIWQIKDLKVDENGRYKLAEVGKPATTWGRSAYVVRPQNADHTIKSATRQRGFCSREHQTCPPDLRADGRWRRTDAADARNQRPSPARFYTRICRHSVERTRHCVGLGKYIEMGRNFDWISNHDRIVLDGTIWATIGSMPQYIQKKELDRISYGWDSIIERAHEGSPRYELLARELARPDRFTRRVLAKHFMEAYSEFMQSDMPLYRRQFPLLDTTYCFLITDETQRPSERNQNMLRAMCFVAKGLNVDIPRVLGVATTGANRAYDFFFMNKKDWTSDNEVLKQKIQKEYGIFVSPRRTEAGEDEYPPRRGD